MAGFKQETYNDVKRITHDAMMYTTTKSIKGYLDELEKIAKKENARAGTKIIELCSALECYCNRTKKNDREKYRGDINISLAGLEMMIVAEDGDDQ